MPKARLAVIPPTAVDDNTPSERIRLRQVREMFRLISEIRELGADPQKWRPHMVRRLRVLLKASIVISSEVHFRKAGHGGGMKVIDVGWVCDADGGVSEIKTERDDERPEAFWLTANLDAVAPTGESAETEAASTSSTREQGEIVPVTPARKIYGGSSFIMSQAALPHIGAVDQLGLHREWGDQSFTATEHRLVRVFHLELAYQWRRDVLRRAEEPTNDLPPRLAQTLEGLLEGSSEKQIANKLGLSRHTVHNYIKALHQRFEVSSRGELLAKAGQIRAEVGPKLSVALPRRTGRKSVAETDAERSKR